MKILKIIFVSLIFSMFLHADYIRDNSNQTVFDTSTSLMWYDDANTNKNWSDANTYCNNLSFAGYANWYLPNFNQLFTLANKDYFNPAIDPAFKNIKKEEYWSSTTFKDDETKAWSVNFYDGTVNSDDKNISKDIYVRCVRETL